MTEPTALAAIFERQENTNGKLDRITDRLNGVLLKQQENGQQIDKINEKLEGFDQWRSNVDNQLSDLEPVKEVSNQLKKIVRWGIVLIIVMVAVQFAPQVIDQLGIKSVVDPK